MQANTVVLTQKVDKGQPQVLCVTFFVEPNIQNVHSLRVTRTQGNHSLDRVWIPQGQHCIWLCLSVPKKYKNGLVPFSVCIAVDGMTGNGCSYGRDAYSINKHNVRILTKRYVILHKTGIIYIAMERANDVLEYPVLYQRVGTFLF